MMHGDGRTDIQSDRQRDDCNFLFGAIQSRANAAVASAKRHSLSIALHFGVEAAVGRSVGRLPLYLSLSLSPLFVR